MLSATRRRALACMLWSISLPALAAQPFEGRWSENPAWCSPEHQGMIDEQPIVITAKQIDLYVSSCRVDRVTKAGAGFRLRTMCWEEGEEGENPTHPATFTLTPKGDRMRIADDSATAWEVVRCPALPQ